MTWRLTLRSAGVSAALSVAVACAQGESDVDIEEGLAAGLDAGIEGGPRLPSSSGSGGASGSNPEPNGDGGTDLEPSPEPGCVGKVVINEVMARGSKGAAEEFIELYNPSSCAISLGGWQLPYRSKSGNGDAVLYTFPAAQSIAAGAYLVLGTSLFAGGKDITIPDGMADEGQVGLLDGAGQIVDALGYGGAVGAYVEGIAAPAAPANGSVGRKSDGLDTDNNGSDCKGFNKPTPGAMNK